MKIKENTINKWTSVCISKSIHHAVLQDRASSLQIQCTCTFKYGKFNWSSCMSLECPSTINKNLVKEI